MSGSKSKKAGSTSSVLRYIQGNRPIVASQCFVSVHRGNAPQRHLPALRRGPRPLAALRVADDETGSCPRPRHKMVSCSQLHFCCCRCRLRLLPENQLWAGGLRGELLLPLQGRVAPQPDLRPGSSPETTIESQLGFLLARLWSPGRWLWIEGLPQMLSPHSQDGRRQL